MITGDTVVAIASSVLPAARMIVRASGGNALALARRICGDLPAPPAAIRSTLAFDGLEAPGWVYLFAAPRSYTGEDLVEFHIPGNAILARMLVDELIRRGARPAEAGEFTARAYFNGRIDLTEAEGVAAAVHAQNEQELSAARQLLSGELSRRLAPLMDALAEMLALVEAGIDFSDEDVSFISSAEAGRRCAEIEGSLEQLVRESARFERLSHEPTFVLVGRPNAGKSTLLNALAGTHRAVVSDTAGTTRDALSAEVALPGGIVRVIDVAGLEDDESAADATATAEITRQMRRRALRAVEEADYVVMVRDVSDRREALKLPRNPDLIVINKVDLEAAQDDENIREGVSALTGENLDALRERMSELAFGRSGGAGLALNGRHLSAIGEAQASLARGRDLAQRSASSELIALELREALDALGNVLGQITPDDVLGRVFATFCIGK